MNKEIFIKETFTDMEKREISKQIKDISIYMVNKEYEQLKKIGYDALNVSERSRIGNNIVDYFTFTHRLETKGKYNINFFDFIVNIDEFEKKKFIKNMLTYYETVKNKNKTKNGYVVLKEVYNICISAINIIRPLVYMEIYSKYKPTSILDFCAGWGGAAVASSILGIKYTGIEINKSLKEPYEYLINYLDSKNENEEKNIKMYFQDALTIDYKTLDYDFVFTSPPYYFIQKYQNNIEYESKKEMDEKFYIPIFNKVYNGLKPGGFFIINVCKEVYDNVLIKLFGEAHDTYPYKKSKRQNEYKEIVYVWNKKL